MEHPVNFAFHLKKCLLSSLLRRASVDKQLEPASQMCEAILTTSKINISAKVLICLLSSAG